MRAIGTSTSCKTHTVISPTQLARPQRPSPVWFAANKNTEYGKANIDEPQAITMGLDES